MWKTFFILVILILLGTSLSAQTADSIKVKPSVMESKKIVEPELDLGLSDAMAVKVYNPKTALLWSVIPGGGQVYNRRWWKVPLVFSAFSGVAAVLNFNNSNYKRFETAYQLELAGQAHEFTGIIEGADRLKVFRDNFNKSRQTGYFYLAGIYLLQGIEAYVDTQLRDFDMDEDLSLLQVQPIFIPPLYSDQSLVLGLALNYTF